MQKPALLLKKLIRPPIQPSQAVRQTSQSLGTLLVSMQICMQKIMTQAQAVHQMFHSQGPILI